MSEYTDLDDCFDNKCAPDYDTPCVVECMDMFPKTNPEGGNDGRDNLKFEQLKFELQDSILKLTEMMGETKKVGTAYLY